VILFKEILSALTRQNLYDPNILQQGKDVELINMRALGMLPIRMTANINYLPIFGDLEAGYRQTAWDRIIPGSDCLRGRGSAM
jgi:hypothetical protein